MRGNLLFQKVSGSEVFFMIEWGSRRVVHFGVTRSPSDAWVTQQLREATPFGEGPRFLICDHDGKFGDQFERVAEGTGSDVIHTPVEAPKANAHCERFIGSVRRELLDHILILSDRHLHRKVKTYVQYFNRARPHQGLDGRIPIRLQLRPPCLGSGAFRFWVACIMTTNGLLEGRIMRGRQK